MNGQSWGPTHLCSSNIWQTPHLIPDAPAWNLTLLHVSLLPKFSCSVYFFPWLFASFSILTFPNSYTMCTLTCGHAGILASHRTYFHILHVFAYIASSTCNYHLPLYLFHKHDLVWGPAITCFVTFEVCKPRQVHLCMLHFHHLKMGVMSELIPRSCCKS